ncbi:uncharacterized protein F5891DRAFT_984083 [Suillus fuscotomentosus]|uniref:CxC2-like cysteine cluster KDZ transposase-associated domain-containing protein n=1 Tax=Suillus fuscotomentosus TaxID=1912939 RepID=A0AAD4DWZ4_9AGAM|nr:uncharacterized protein F5891DRAFT_984083 [Suillus fuscotomentosus]KAG1895644.1 hypothetical protein F5891DRAFT_984083 [Suillus fuscotomentosus]
MKVGLHIHLAHDGTPCPSSTEYSSDLFEWSDTDEHIDHNDYPEGTSIPLVADSDHPATTIVNKSGVHSVSIWYCHCPGALNPDMQLFQAGLFPASFTRPKTAFTFSVLDDFLLDNLECGTSAMNYYSKIRRLTSSIFPLMVLDRYRELMRTVRQWRQCKLYKWHGFAHKNDEPKTGDLALFCPACPQPGINLDRSTGTATQPDDTPSWLFTRTLVMDGNFKAEHLHPVNPSNEVSLIDGLAFMVGDERYKSHLAVAQDHVQKSDCNNHHAVNQANASRQKLEATGIGGCACARHGCFVPHSMVDFQKGERQMNMDYALSQALNYNTDGISQAIMFYDINCQYNKFLKDRIASSMYLSIPIGMDIIPGIGLWHVHGHQDSCYVRIDGEIMETLWASLNIISPSARGMGTPHRKEVLDYQMNDSNFMKMIRITKFLCRKFKEAVQGAAESTLSFQNLNETVQPAMVILWEAEEAVAQANRLEDPTAMDIYEVWLEKGKSPTRKQQELRLLEAQNRPDHPATNSPSWRGAATWLATVDGNEQDSLVDTVHNSPDEDYSDLDDDHNPDPDPETHHASIFQPELTILPLPSNLGIVRCNELGLTDLMKEETAFREGQANDALHAIRVHLGDKAVIFWNTIRSAKSQASSTRAWTQLAKLPDHDLLKKYLPLKKEHLKANAAVADPNARGQRDATLAWFWSINVQGDTSGNDWMTEFYQVNWLRTKALCDRWNEEVILVKHEMQWSVNFFTYKAKQWLSLMDNATYTGLTGHACYAARQCHIYRQLAAHAVESFQKVIPVIQPEVPVVSS